MLLTMDDDLVYLCSALVVSLLAIAAVQLLKPRPRLPPGPLNLPVIGSAHRLVNALPHRTMRELASVYGPLMYLRVGHVPVVVVTSKELAREILKTHDAIFATRPKLMSGDIVAYGSTDLLFCPTPGDYFRKLRKLCVQEILSNDRIRSFQDVREDEVRSLVEDIRAAGPSAPLDLSRKIYKLTNGIVSRAAFGMKSSKAEDFVAAIKHSFVYSTGFSIPDLFPGFTGILSFLTGMRRNLEGVRDTIDGILEEIIDEREQILKSGRSTASEKNLVEVLLGLIGNEDFGFPITRSTVKAVVLDIFAGGTETSGTSMEWAMSELVMNPKVMKKLQGEIREAFRGKEFISETDLRASGSCIKYLGLVIKETFRLHPPAPILVPRESTEACEINGYVIPAKTRVIINSWAIMRDPQYWEDAEEFRPERFEGTRMDFHGGCFEYTPFGSGKRMCPGFNYGMASMELTLVQLLHSFDWSLPEGVDRLDMTETVSLSLTRKTHLMLRAVPYAPPPSS
ncbi:premnaspirodiene oxygenase [Aegilops tauschii subsp. strangulata]|nr:premnaspirodiene oxygenase [Aegilops tauschii subsp. strangulata]